ncbi:GNAT family N-acetyltransferase [Achromobacter deleyi]|uniref:GNAT family N-acetyltransferase n=1 Tax=Achromobacter deleyi TaxID=1353891 RepID=UPI0014911CEB|nr:GNAT family N-acetyltransferase [Achromobacter deleyi]QVQ29780.1 GNAT family N-acetyltransferase [Achromobacter deleyi]UIP23919.1 GNAT family N-acetyltransferase [Achromobacter deleyi]
MQAGDVDAILDAQAQAYPQVLLESAGFFLNRLALAPSYCWVAQAARPEERQGLLGYLVSYPWDAGLPPALDVPLAALPRGADHWFLHDCAVVPAAQGLGVGQALVRTAAQGAVGDGLQRASLVSLASAVSYWLRHGYAPVAARSGELAEKLAGYGPDARYMSRAFPL